jgi:hypothetical protein
MTLTMAVRQLQAGMEARGIRLPGMAGGETRDDEDDR